MTVAPLEFMGAPGSPYTRKMLALLRYRRIPYRVSWQPRGVPQGRPAARVPLLPTFYLPDDAGVEVALTDSSPLLRRFEREYQGRSVLPSNPVLGLLNLILEDFADEWLTKAMFHYRWSYAADIKKAGDILPRWGQISGDEGEMQKIAEFIRERQISRLSYVGSNAITAPVIEASFARYLALMDAHITEHPFLLGQRPAASDFAAFGQLTALALFDPTPQALVLAEHPRIYAWVEILEDLSGYEVADDGWLHPDTLPQTLLGILGEIGRVYVPYLRANAAAVVAGADEMVAEIDGQEWRQNPFPYQAKCLRWLREAYEELADTDRRALASVLEQTSLIALFSDVQTN